MTNGEVLKAVERVGIPTLFALVLLGMLTGFIPGLVTRDYIQEHLRQGQETVHLLRLICINTGNGPETIQVCLKALDGKSP